MQLIVQVLFMRRLAPLGMKWACSYHRIGGMSHSTWFWCACSCVAGAPVCWFCWFLLLPGVGMVVGHPFPITWRRRNSVSSSLWVPLALSVRGRGVCGLLRGCLLFMKSISMQSHFKPFCACMTPLRACSQPAVWVHHFTQTCCSILNLLSASSCFQLLFPADVSPDQKNVKAHYHQLQYLYVLFRNPRNCG